MTGNLFGKSYFLYHLLTFVIHISAGFMIYKVAKLIFKNDFSGFLAAFLYVVNPLHFVSLFWISGSATMIGFLFFITSFYSYMVGKKLPSLISFVFSLLASEAMIAGLAVFFAWEFFGGRKKLDFRFLPMLSAVSLGFLTVRYFFFTPKITFDVYQLELSQNTFLAVKYYILRILGFGEVSADLVPTVLILGFLATLIVLLFKKSGDLRILAFFLSVIFFGLFPFVLIPSHLSPHYMNISAFGFSILAAFSLLNNPKVVQLVLGLLFLVSAFLTVNLTTTSNWVVKRSTVAKYYIDRIEQLNPRKDTQLIFNDNQTSTSQAAYVSLGTGEALKFWFGDKNYGSCFSFFQKCEARINSLEID